MPGLPSIKNRLHTAAAFFLLLIFAQSTPALAAAVDSLSPSITTAPLSVDQVVDNLIRRNEERAQALLHSESTRVYHLAYRGFPGDRDAEMTVEATYDSPSTKNFKVVSQNGSKLVIDRVFKRLLESEKEAAEPEMRARTLLNRDNYDFALVGFEPPGVDSPAKDGSKAGQYILAVSPKIRSKYVYRGKVWVDAADFAVTKIDAEPAQNPSFWTKKNEVHQEYLKLQNFWLPLRNQSISDIRLGGRATLTIDYSNYRVTDAKSSQKPTSPSTVDVH